MFEINIINKYKNINNESASNQEQRRKSHGHALVRGCETAESAAFSPTSLTDSVNDKLHVSNSELKRRLICFSKLHKNIRQKHD